MPANALRWLREFHQRAPFHFFTGNIFASIGRQRVRASRPNGRMMDGFIATDGMNLNGLPLKLNDYNGKLIKQLP